MLRFPWRPAGVLCIVSVLAAGCGGNAPLNPNPCIAVMPTDTNPVCRLTVQPAYATMRVGDTLTFHATAVYTPDSVFTWASSDTTLLRVDRFGHAQAVAVTNPAVGLCANNVNEASGCATVIITQ